MHNTIYVYNRRNLSKSQSIVLVNLQKQENHLLTKFGKEDIISLQSFLEKRGVNKCQEFQKK